MMEKSKENFVEREIWHERASFFFNPKFRGLKRFFIILSENQSVRMFYDGKLENIAAFYAGHFNASRIEIIGRDLWSWICTRVVHFRILFSIFFATRK